MDKSSVIFGNPMDPKTLAKAEKAKAGFLKKFGDDTEKVYHLALKPIDQIPELGIENLVHSDQPLELPENALIVGNIRMGFGHYRIARWPSDRGHRGGVLLRAGRRHFDCLRREEGHEDHHRQRREVRNRHG